MDTTDFLRAVLPAEGVYVSGTLAKGLFKQAFHESVDQLAAAVAEASAKKEESYYAIAAFKDKNSRKGDNARAFRVIAMDVDVGEGKGYPDQASALSALTQFNTGLGLPKPLVISSGGGLHVYWILEEELSPDRWEPLARGMKNAAAIAGFQIDPTKTGDLATILRPVGTCNYKTGTPRVVTVIDDKYTLVAVAALERLFAGQVSKSSHSVASQLEVKKEYPPANAAAIAMNCPQIAQAVTEQEKVDEPLWYAMMGIAWYCEDRENVAIAWSDQHSKYTKAKTLAKLNQWGQANVGPTTCVKFDSVRKGICSTCTFHNTITSPIQIGRVAEKVKDNEITSVPIPGNYLYTTEGIKLLRDGIEEPICPYNLYAEQWGDDFNNDHLAHFKFQNYNKEWRQLVLTYGDISSGGKDLLKACGAQGLVVPPGNLAKFQTLMRSFLKQLETSVKRVAIYDQYGWTKDGTGFVYGDRIYTPTGVGQATLGVKAQELSPSLTQKGDLDSWVAIISKVFALRGMEPLSFMLGVGLAAPMWRFTHANSMVVSYVGPTGSGKTLTQKILQSIYGNPRDLHTPFHTTANAIWERVGALNNLPVTLDETTLMDEEETKALVFTTSSDKTKQRLTRAGTLRPSTTWSTLLTVSTNQHFLERLSATSFQDVAITARIAEFVLDAVPILQVNELGRKVHDFVHANYGVAGHLWIDHLVKLGEEGIQRLLGNARKSVNSRYKWESMPEARFYTTLIMTVMAAMEEAKHIGLIKFDPRPALDYAAEYLQDYILRGTEKEEAHKETEQPEPESKLVQVAHNEAADGPLQATPEWQTGSLAYYDDKRRRAKSIDMKQSSVDILSKFLAAYAMSHTVIFRSRDIGQTPVWDAGVVPRGEIYIRYQLMGVVKGSQSLYSTGFVTINYNALRDWLMKYHNYSWRAFVLALEKEGVKFETGSTYKQTLGRGTMYKTPQVRVIKIELNSHRDLAALLDEGITPMAEQSHLKVVK